LTPIYASTWKGAVSASFHARVLHVGVRIMLAPGAHTIRAWRFECLPPNWQLVFNHFGHSVLLAIFTIPNAAMPCNYLQAWLFIVFAAEAPFVEMILQSGCN
jgi:hypothetical protein